MEVMHWGSPVMEMIKYFQEPFGLLPMIIE